MSFTASVSSRRARCRETAVEHIQRWHHKGWRVGFTSGCFDLLHASHVHLLEAARASCDRLVVGLRSDASIRRAVSSLPPMQPEAARAAVLASLASVDLVTVFDQDTPEALAEALHTDLQIKGEEVVRDRISDAELVR